MRKILFTVIIFFGQNILCHNRLKLNLGNAVLLQKPITFYLNYEHGILWVNLNNNESKEFGGPIQWPQGEQEAHPSSIDFEFELNEKIYEGKLEIEPDLEYEIYLPNEDGHCGEGINIIRTNVDYNFVCVKAERL